MIVAISFFLKGHYIIVCRSLNLQSLKMHCYLDYSKAFTQKIVYLKFHTVQLMGKSSFWAISNSY